MQSEYLYTHKKGDLERILEDSLELYGFKVTMEELHKEMSKADLATVESSGKYSMVRVRKVYLSASGALKIFILDNGTFGMSNNLSRPEYHAVINMNYKSSEVAYELNEHIEEGKWLLVSSAGYSGREYEIVCNTDTTDITSARQWLKLLDEIKDRRDSHFQEINKVPKIVSDGYVTTSALQAQIVLLEEAKLQAVENEKVEEVRRATALGSIQMKTNKRNETTFDFTGLDNHFYSLTLPYTKLTKENLLGYVWIHRYNLNAYTLVNIKRDTWLASIIDLLCQQETPSFKITMDKRSVLVKSKTIVSNGNKMRIWYLQSKRVAYSDMRITVHDYLLEGKPLSFPEERESNETQLRDLKKERDKILTENGIKGTLEDLEGEYTVQLGFEKKGQNWNLVIGEKRIILKGGRETVKKLENVLTGKTQRWKTGHSVQEFYRRLQTILDKETALEVVSEIRSMGKLLNALQTKE
jgi:hypothetical protein